LYYSNEIIDEVRSANDIVDVVSSYVKIQKKGANYMGLCPFHAEKSPSFSVSPSKQLFHCFGCGVGGDVIAFIRQYENYSFTEALTLLAKRANIELPQVSDNDRAKNDEKNIILEINKTAAKYFYENLLSKEGEIGLKYFKDRGLESRHITHFGLGFAKKTSNDLYQYLKGMGYGDDILKKSDFMVFKDALETGGDIRGISIPGGAAEFSRKKIDKLTDEAKHYGAKGLLWIKVEEDGFSSSASKFLNDGELTKVAERCGSKPGDIIFIVSAQPKVVFDTLGWLRRKIAGILGLLDDNKFNFLWVVDFPMFEKDDEGNLKAMHHPFTQPKLDELDKLDGDILSLNADAYDIVLNGVELGGGSIRIHDRELQDKMFKVLGLGEEERIEKFGFFIEAFKYGAPPHAGLAYGLDRMVMLLLGESSIREVIAFPKNANAECPVSEAPGNADSVQLEELGLAVVTKHEQN